MWVGLIAVNDVVILRNHIPRIIKRHFREKDYYVELLDLFNEVEFQTASGQLIDLIITIEGEKDLSKYSLPVHRRIVQYKTAYYSFYLSVACALVMSGEKLDDHLDVKNILIDMGIYSRCRMTILIASGTLLLLASSHFQIGTDIEDFKCSWLVVKALEISNDEQKKLLYDNYGKDDAACVAKVKELYKELNLELSIPKTGALSDHQGLTMCSAFMQKRPPKKLQINWKWELVDLREKYHLQLVGNGKWKWIEHFTWCIGTGNVNCESHPCSLKMYRNWSLS
ncbi:hypothetical protein Droror1_Dr00023769 [Drosera rotundifolia]